MAGEDELSQRAREGVEHFQAAAKELIAAGRALLDAAEEIVEEPATIEQLATDVGSVLRLAGDTIVRALSSATSARGGSGPEDPQRVQRIRVS